MGSGWGSRRRTPPGALTNLFGSASGGGARLGTGALGAGREGVEAPGSGGRPLPVALTGLGVASEGPSVEGLGSRRLTASEVLAKLALAGGSGRRRRRRASSRPAKASKMAPTGLRLLVVIGSASAGNARCPDRLEVEPFELR